MIKPGHVIFCTSLGQMLSYSSETKDFRSLNRLEPKASIQDFDDNDPMAAL